MKPSYSGVNVFKGIQNEALHIVTNVEPVSLAFLLRYLSSKDRIPINSDSLSQLIRKVDKIIKRFKER